MDTGIGDRVAKLLPAGQTRREIAAQVGMTPDAFSRALSGQRGFAAIELANLAELLHQDVYFLITGEPDPHRLVVAARHDYDSATGRRDVPGAADDEQTLADVHLAYRQAELGGSAGSPLPQSAAEARTQLGDGFVRPFIDRLEALGIDVVRLPHLSTSYCFVEAGRPVVVVPASGNWFRENWCLAHELGHLALGHIDRGLPQDERNQHEAEANRFAADLLLPAGQLRVMDWADVSSAELASRIWELGVSTDALGRRLESLRISVAAPVAEWANQPTLRLLRRHWQATESGDPITTRMDAAATRRFPLALQDAHVEQIASGRLPKVTLAWMLGVDADTLEVDEPVLPESMSVADLSAALGI